MHATPPDGPGDPREQRPRRTFSELENPKGVRDVHGARSSVRMYATVAAVPSFLMGAALGVFLVIQGTAPVWIAALCPFILATAAAVAVVWITGSAGSAASTLYTPSGKTTPPKRQYSQAEAMVVQGRYEDGITAFELAVSEDATDPTPYLRIARVYRDHLNRNEDAARWFRRALRESAIPGGLALLALKELEEVFTHRLGQPERALPDLARLAEELAGTDGGAWAARRLAEIKARLSSPSPEEEADPGTTP
ncbi:MAG TPA: tetratricopeptide repeat protein [Longimicrobiales bacterium]|nr:tetratricopeptide repeat protein [Longimicrobiales bacterium]